ncbi:MAG: sigma-54 dependent transcriptional regulator [Planctomycetota bacterium]
MSTVGNHTVLVVDDKEMMRDSVSSTLRRAGFAVTAAESAEGALAAFVTKRPDVIVTDLKMPDQTGLDLLASVREVDQDLPVVLMTAFGTIETAVEAMKLGAFDYVTKPFQGDEMVITVKRACRHVALVRENEVLRASAEFRGVGDAPVSAKRGGERLVGSSPAMRRVREQVAAVADSQSTVLVVGESGAGKEVVARAIHESSVRKAQPFLAVNCAALSETLLESELFGHEKGAFTGADKLRKGRFELADRGTLLLDEVSEIPPSLQAKLLRVLQERSFERVGSSTTIGVDVRVVATSNRDLPRAVSRGEFRQDLFFRLNVLPVHLPPLRERLEDIPELAASFIELICAREGQAVMTFDPSALDLLLGYAWPGNVRELQNICERAVVIGRASGGQTLAAELIRPWLGMASDPVGAGDIPPMPDVRIDGPAARGFVHGFESAAVAAATNGLAVEAGTDDLGPIARKQVTLEEMEREAIVTTLARFNGHRQKTAKSLGIGVRTLGLKLKKWKQAQLVPESL